MAAFVGGLVWPRASAAAGKAVLLLGPVLYAVCRVPGWVMDAPEGGVAKLVYDFSTMAFLHHMFTGIRFLIMDASHEFVSKQFGRSSAQAVLVASLLLTVALGAKLFGMY